MQNSKILTRIFILTCLFVLSKSKDVNSNDVINILELLNPTSGTNSIYEDPIPKIIIPETSLSTFPNTYNPKGTIKTFKYYPQSNLKSGQSKVQNITLNSIPTTRSKDINVISLITPKLSELGVSSLNFSNEGDQIEDIDEGSLSKYNETHLLDNLFTSGQSEYQNIYDFDVIPIKYNDEESNMVKLDPLFTHLDSNNDEILLYKISDIPSSSSLGSPSKLRDNSIEISEDNLTTLEPSISPYMEESKHISFKNVDIFDKVSEKVKVGFLRGLRKKYSNLDYKISVDPIKIDINMKIPLEVTFEPSSNKLINNEINEGADK
ncbi:uncharacterized protein CMU_001060 [Cryptosporidium muris RN66]|uniref:Uncharacterized protein n=1 Tax=Cryptosporidium muris (strain RN66) TaxID=441375 RepID=B6AG94_CRYMR|nr:uncharacterized protein CMU_001060 [Cryptosporidium muris RN66]EEA07235.1 hypothetical protein CMU_001060 [Cryptosporidium muris RN66]|eukprot:XP_002141584.1 hypothetical protein [Cryptosporidium muris RN66]